MRMISKVFKGLVYESSSIMVQVCLCSDKRARVLVYYMNHAANELL